MIPSNTSLGPLSGSSSTLTTPAERRKAFANADAICALEGFTEADKTPDMIRQREAVIYGRMTSAEAVAEAKANAAKRTQ